MSATDDPAQHANLEEAVAAWAMQCPAGAAALRAEGAAAERETIMSGMEARLAAARLEGANAEAERSTAVRAQAVPGQEALVEQLASDGQTSPEQAAVKILAAVRMQMVAQAAAHQAGAPAALEFTEPSDARADGGGDAEIDPKVLAERIQEVMAANPGMNILAAKTKAMNTITPGGN